MRRVTSQKYMFRVRRVDWEYAGNTNKKLKLPKLSNNSKEQAASTGSAGKATDDTGVRLSCESHPVLAVKPKAPSLKATVDGVLVLGKGK